MDLQQAIREFERRPSARSFLTYCRAHVRVGRREVLPKFDDLWDDLFLRWGDIEADNVYLEFYDLYDEDWKDVFDFIDLAEKRWMGTGIPPPLPWVLGKVEEILKGAWLSDWQIVRLYTAYNRSLEVKQGIYKLLSNYSKYPERKIPMILRLVMSSGDLSLLDDLWDEVSLGDSRMLLACGLVTQEQHSAFFKKKFGQDREAF